MQEDAAKLFWPQGRPLTEPVFELVMASALPSSAVASVTVERAEATVVRSSAPVDPDAFDISRHYDEGPTPLLHRG